MIIAPLSIISGEERSWDECRESKEIMSVDIKETAEYLAFEELRVRFATQCMQLPEFIRLQDVTHQLRTLLVQLQEAADASSSNRLPKEFLDRLLILPRHSWLRDRGGACLFAGTSLLLGDFGRLGPGLLQQGLLGH